jgi:biopolymer transport protein ExbD
MKKFVIGIITVSLLVIALTGLYMAWTNHQRAKEAEAALANSEANKPQRYKAEVQPGNPNGSNSPDEVVVLVDDEGRMKLNSEEAGTTGDTSQLRAKLEQYFRERRDRSPSRTVFVKASSKLPYTEVTKVVDAAKGAGAEPVGLQVVDPK